VIDVAHYEHITPRKLEQPLDDGLRLTRFSLDRTKRFLVEALRADDLRVAEDDSKRAVDLVCDARRKPADRGELVRAKELALMVRELPCHVVDAAAELRELVAARKRDPMFELAIADAPRAIAK